ncbi:MAG: diacylglycerol kinase [Porcipelethomonas sp.]
MKNDRYTNHSLFSSIKCAASGIKSAFRTEKNFTSYIIIAAVFLVLNFITGSGRYDYVVYTICTFSVIGAEMFNTALERICDSRTHENSSDIQFIKDVSAGAVLVLGVCFFICEGIVLCSNLVKMVRA